MTEGSTRGGSAHLPIAAYVPRQGIPGLSVDLHHAPAGRRKNGGRPCKTSPRQTGAGAGIVHTGPSAGNAQMVFSLDGRIEDYGYGRTMCSMCADEVAAVHSRVGVLDLTDSRSTTSRIRSEAF